ncbi:signal peptidase I [Rhodococcus sp. NPDC058505]|uniref:signal peptidase I n=1 Tax=unclassified Rhodococcus (in: high G+C Gram-positive bacteria) TaxID=192944 RepID=UPI00364D0DB6
MAIHVNTPVAGRSRGREIALNVGAIAGLICVLAAAVSFLFGVTPLVFRSGSMSPEIPTGALALSKATEAGDLAVGDVVSVLDQQGTRITHRIREIVSTDGTNAVLILKGDANKDADISPYTVTEVDRVFFSVPGLGYAVSWLSSPMAIFLGGGLVGGVMVLAFGPGSKRKGDTDSDDSGTTEPGAHERIVRPAVTIDDAPTQQIPIPKLQLTRVVPARTAMVLGAVGLTALAASATGTSAAWTGTNTANSGVFASAAKLLPPVSSSNCWTDSGAGYKGAVVNWTNPPAPFTVRILVRGGQGEILKTINPTPNPGAYQEQWIDRGNMGANTNWRYTAEIHTVNPAGEVSAEWRGTKIWQQYTNTVWCDGNVTGTTSGAGFFSRSVSGGDGPGPDALAQEESAPSDPTIEPTVSPSASATATATTAPTTSTGVPAPTTTTSVPPSSTSVIPAPPTTTDSTPPAEVEEESSAPTQTAPAGDPSPSGSYFADVSGGTATVTDGDGTPTYTGTLGPGAQAVWDTSSDTLWIVDGKKLTSVDAATGTQTAVDPTSDTVPADVAALVVE